jgi:energy-coupling factor transporter transmembrane protein EcfT
MKQSLAIIGLSIGACVLYGVVHDLVATQICLVYFTAFYPLPPVLLESRILLGCVLGVASTWWVGLILGALVALFARAGRLPKLDWRKLLRPFAALLVIASVGAAVSGIVAYFLAEYDVLRLQDPMTFLIPREHESGFWTVGFMNLAGYAIVFVGGIVILIWIRVWRRRQASLKEKGE